MQTATKNNYELNDYIIQTSGEEIISLSHNPKRKKRTLINIVLIFVKGKFLFIEKKETLFSNYMGNKCEKSESFIYFF
jgi:hypothetical protein